MKRSPSYPILSQAWLLGPAFVSLGISLPAEAMPQGGTVVSGSATISQNGSALKVVQTTDKAAINWQSYNISASESVTYYQPSISSITLNRILGGSTSFIDGKLTANGQVWLSNPAGIHFGPNARVNVGGLIATTHDLKVEDFDADRYRFKSDTQPSGIVENQGRITVADAGLAAFVAPGVVNHGVITARLGEVTLASGNEFTVDLYGDQKINLALDNKVAKQVLGRDGKPLTALVKNDGQIFADGGRIQITAAAAKGIVDNVVSIGGIVQARSVEESNGEIVLSGEGGAVQVSGTLDASGRPAGRRGGTVAVSGNSVRVKSGARIDVSGTAGGGQALIGGDFRGGRASAAEYEEYALRPARKPVPPAETTTVEAGAVLTADALSTDHGGELIVWSDSATTVKGTLTARGGAGGGDGGFIETSGHWLDVAGVSASTKAFRGVSGTWLLDPYNVTIDGTGGVGTAFVGSGSGDTSYLAASTSTILASSIETALANGSVTIDTGTAAGSDAGIITVSHSIVPPAVALNATLKLKAANGIIMAPSVVIDATQQSGTSHPLNVVFQANAYDAGAGSIVLKAGSGIKSAGGAITLSGGSDYLNSGYAVGDPTHTPYADGITLYSSTLQSAGGNILIRGMGGSSAAPSVAGNSDAIGILTDGATIDSGAGSIAMYGKSKNVGQTISHALELSQGAGSTITSSKPNDPSAIYIEGDSSAAPTVADGFGNYADAQGVQFNYGTSVSATSSGGGVTIVGRAKSINYGITSVSGGGSNSISVQSGGTITLRTDHLRSTWTGTLSGSGGYLVVEPVTASTSIGVGGGGGTLTLSGSYFSSYFSNGFAGITIGRADGTGAIDAKAFTFRDPLTLLSGGAGADITLTGAISDAGTGTSSGGLTVKAGRNITTVDDSSITTHGQPVILWSNFTGTGGYINLGTSAPITTNGGALWLGGGNASAGTLWNGLTVGNGYAQGYDAGMPMGIFLSSGAISTAGGSIAMHGKSTDVTTSNKHTPDNNPNAAGIVSSFTDQYSINSGVGSILLDGISVVHSANYYGPGVYLNGGTMTSAATSGDAISITGDSSTTSLNSSYHGEGVVLVAWSSTKSNTIQATGGGNIVITGTGAPTGNYSSGIRLADSSDGVNTILTSGGTGGITLTGTATDTGSNSYSVVTGSADVINSSGALSVSGTSREVYLAGEAIVTGVTSFSAAGQNITATNTNNDFGGAVSVTDGATIALLDKNAMTLGGINATGTVTASTTTGNLTLSGAIATTDASSNAVTLTAGSGAAAGTSTGGDIVISGSPTVTIGSGGRATLYTGSIAGSTALTTLISSGSGHFRYKSKAGAANYTTALGSGVYGIYREARLVTITAADASKTADGTPYSGGNGVTYSGWANGDTSAAFTGTPTYSGTSQGATTVGTYVITPGGYSSGYGYTPSYANGTLTISAAPAPSSPPSSPSSPSSSPSPSPSAAPTPAPEPIPAPAPTPPIPQNVLVPYVPAPSPPPVSPKGSDVSTTLTSLTNPGTQGTSAAAPAADTNVASLPPSTPGGEGAPAVGSTTSTSSDTSDTSSGTQGEGKSKPGLPPAVAAVASSVSPPSAPAGSGGVPPSAPPAPPVNAPAASPAPQQARTETAATPAAPQNQTATPSAPAGGQSLAQAVDHTTGAVANTLAVAGTPPSDAPSIAKTVVNAMAADIASGTSPAAALANLQQNTASAAAQTAASTLPPTPQAGVAVSLAQGGGQLSQAVDHALGGSAATPENRAVAMAAIQQAQAGGADLATALGHAGEAVAAAAQQRAASSVPMTADQHTVASLAGGSPEALASLVASGGTFGTALAAQMGAGVSPAAALEQARAMTASAEAATKATTVPLTADQKSMASLAEGGAGLSNAVAALTAGMSGEQGAALTQALNARLAAGDSPAQALAAARADAASASQQRASTVVPVGPGDALAAAINNGLSTDGVLAAMGLKVAVDSPVGQAAIGAFTGALAAGVPAGQALAMAQAKAASAESQIKATTTPEDGTAALLAGNNDPTVRQAIARALSEGRSASEAAHAGEGARQAAAEQLAASTVPTDSRSRLLTALARGEGVEQAALEAAPALAGGRGYTRDLFKALLQPLSDGQGVNAGLYAVSERAPAIDAHTLRAREGVPAPDPKLMAMATGEVQTELRAELAEGVRP